MDITNIETFLHVAELENFTKAAEELSYAQSTVTTQIQQLERELGFPLFDRVGKHVSLTQLGEKFRAHADDILHIWFQACMLGRKEEEMSGTLYVGALESLLFSALPDVQERFRSRYRNVEVQIRMGQATELAALLKQNRLDLIYISGNLSTEPGLSRRYARRERLVFFAAPNHPLASRKRIPLSEVLEYNIIATEHSGFCYTRLNELASAQRLLLKHCLLVDSTVAVAELVNRGMGLSFLPEYSITKHLQEGHLVKLDIDVPPQSYFSQILYHKDKWIAPFVDGFVDIVRELRPEVIK